MALKVYVSYAWKAEEDSGVVAALETALAGQGVELVRDVRALGYGGSIRAFMDEIAAAEQVVVVLSPQYVESPYCMYELIEMAQLGDFRERVYPILLDGLPISQPSWRNEIRASWESRYWALKAELDATDSVPAEQSLDDLKAYSRIFHHVLGPLVTLADINALSEAVHRQTNFAALIARLRGVDAGRAPPTSKPAIVRRSEAEVVARTPVPPPAPTLIVPKAPQPLLQLPPKPWWADTVLQDAKGAFVPVDWLGLVRRLAWDAPSRIWQGDSGLGVDEYGLYGDARFSGVSQRFRWIPPGEFWIGSPEGEVGRDRDEGPRHRVRLTEGFWLAETVCSQSVWVSVMGSNPSRFKDDPQNPVEQVSWDDVQGFLREVEKRLPGLKADLPTEAEWEYACRAGSETAFSWGDGITPEQANYGATYSDADGSTGEYRGRTVPVRSFVPNAWGLYQMHGNVWEWCADSLRAYSGAPRIDSRGPEGVDRVLRGGSWNNRLRRYAADRIWINRGARSYGIGFRLALRSKGPEGSVERPPEALVTRDA
ncbi:SUMF1/EgtB/PvdO family nonheme iron enzyme [Zoogloea sp.]|uniref:SUMF1/EgtB/PvdO family nonheme iron enzyme n=1 Tax=Zoogloea sp. TaxID=49181 RepID=UPI0035B08721